LDDWIRDKHPESATLDNSLFFKVPFGVSHPEWMKRGSKEARQDCACLPPDVSTLEYLGYNTVAYNIGTQPNE
jgi:hypothetical protein